MNILIKLAGFISCVNLIFYACQVWKKKVASTSIASWLMWSIITAVLLVNTMATNQPYALSLGYLLGTLCIFFAQIRHGTWVWTYIETLSLIGVVTSIIICQKINPESGLIAIIIALNLAGIPFIKNMWKNPDPTSFLMFFIAAIASALAFMATWPWTMKESFFPGGSMIFNGSLCLIVRRKKRRRQKIPMNYVA